MLLSCIVVADANYSCKIACSLQVALKRAREYEKSYILSLDLLQCCTYLKKTVHFVALIT